MGHIRGYNDTLVAYAGHEVSHLTGIVTNNSVMQVTHLEDDVLLARSTSRLLGCALRRLLGCFFSSLLSCLLSCFLSRFLSSIGRLPSFGILPAGQ